MTDNTEAAQFLDRHGIEYVHVEDELLIVTADLNLNNRSLTVLPDLTKVRVVGAFNVCDNQLTSLEGAPTLVKSFACARNHLTSLKGAPSRLRGYFDCADNKLESLKGGPRIVGGDFYCQNNDLSSLEGGPKTVRGDYYCFANPLSSYKGLPTTKGGVIDSDGLVPPGTKEKPPQRGY